MPKTKKVERILLQVRVTEAQKRRFKALANSRGLTLEKALVEAFAAWAEKLRSHPNAKPSSSPAPTPVSFAWLSRALHLDWSQCPQAELLQDGQHQLWVIRETDIPLVEVLRASGEGCSVSEIAEIFSLEPSQLEEVMAFAKGMNRTDALN